MNAKINGHVNVHEFAFYYADLHTLAGVLGIVTLLDEELFHRCKNVVRMQQNEQCVLFNRHEHATFIFQRCEGKNKIIGYITDFKTNKVLTPHITFLLPLLKIDALTDAVYSCAEVGITKIQLLVTAKTQIAYSQKILDKLYRVAIAAAEQSKMYAFPEILPAIKLEDWLDDNYQGVKLHFDVTGKKFDQWNKLLHEHQDYYLLIGPEGDLTSSEKEQVVASGFVPCLLTNTVLRSVRAVSLISGLVRL